MTKQTEQLIHQTLQKHRDQLETLPENTRVADTARWGYCNKKGWVIYNYQLTALPPQLAEYIIIHEAVHLTHFHHQKGFHHKLESIIPDHRQRETTTKIPRHTHRHLVHKIEGGGVNPSVHEKRPSRR